MDFIFAPSAETVWDTLHQGDVLEKSDALKNAVAQAHPYYADAADYTHFLVLTQSCDLVRRNGKAKSRYIVLAAMRPLSLVIDRLVEKHRYSDLDFPLQLCQKDRERGVTQTLERLLHNTEDGHFFVRALSHPNIKSDLCGFLALSIALRIDHYDACISSKIAQMAEVFQAKLGWLTGHQYSRVATPDIEEKLSDPEEYKRRFYSEVLYGQTAWLTSLQYKMLKSKVVEWKKENPGVALDEGTARALIDQVPPDMEILADRIVNQFVQSKLIEKKDDVVMKAKNLIANDRLIQRVVSELLAD